MYDVNVIPRWRGARPGVRSARRARTASEERADTTETAGFVGREIFAPRTWDGRYANTAAAWSDRPRDATRRVGTSGTMTGFRYSRPFSPFPLHCRSNTSARKSKRRR